MARRSSWSALAALLVLLFVTAEALRGVGSQIGDQIEQASSRRGRVRFSPKSTEEPVTTVSSTSASITARSRSGRDRSKTSTVKTILEAEVRSSSLSDKRSNFRAGKAESTHSSTSPPQGKAENHGGFLRRGASRKESVESPVAEPLISKTNDRSEKQDRKYLPGSNEKRRIKKNEQDVQLETPKENLSPRRGSLSRLSTRHLDDQLESTGPSVFAGPAEFSRSRTGRKIHNAYNSRDLRTQVPSASRYTGRNAERNSSVENTTAESKATEVRSKTTNGRLSERGASRSNASNVSKGVTPNVDNSVSHKKEDVVLSESESVRVDVPLDIGQIEGATGAAKFGVTSFADASGSSSFSSQTHTSRNIDRRSDDREHVRSSGKDGRINSDRSKSRARSSTGDVEFTSAGSRSGSRRGLSRFSNAFATTDSTSSDETTTRSESRRTNSRDRSSNVETKSRSSSHESRPKPRGRNGEGTSRYALSSSVDQADIKRRSSGDRSAFEGRSRSSDVRSKHLDSRGHDQDTRMRNRGRSKLETTTSAPWDTWTTSETIGTESTTSINSETVTTTTSPTIVTTTTLPTSTTARGRGNGRGRGGNSQTRRPSKEDFFNHGLGFRGRKPPTSSNLEDSKRTNSSLRNESQARGNPGWTLRRRPGHAGKSDEGKNTKASVASAKEQSNEVITSNEQTTSGDALTTTTPAARRGSTRPKVEKDGSGGRVETATKATRRGNKTFDKTGSPSPVKENEDSQNYPPDFKARLSQLKTTTTKLPGAISNSRTTPEGKKSSAALFAERSRMKLELARRLIKPEFHVGENDLESTTAFTVNRQQLTEAPAGDESRKVTKITKVAGQQSARGQSVNEKSQEDAASKGSSKLSRLRKGFGERGAKLSRPLGSKKGRIISERTVTSISIEEVSTSNVVEVTTRSYTAAAHRIKTSSEEPSVTTGIPSQIASSDNLVEEKGKEDAATTVKPLQAYVTTPRGLKNLEEEKSDAKADEKSNEVLLQTTKVDIESTTTASKSSTPSRGGKSYNEITSATTVTPEESYTTEIPIVTTFKSRKSTRVTSPNSGKAKKSNFESPRRSVRIQEDFRRTKSSTESAEVKKQSRPLSSGTKSSFQPRYTKKLKQKSDLSNDVDQHTTGIPRTSSATSRYTKKKDDTVKFSDSLTTGSVKSTGSQGKRREFRPRTATYRRHSEDPVPLIGTSTKDEIAGVAITPRPPRYHATIKSTTPSSRPVSQEPLVNLQISNETSGSTGITDSNNGISGNSNIFNPTRSVFLSTGNTTLLEQLRSTVAPLLNSLGNKTPVFSGSYQNVSNGNSAPRITPSGAPPRFSARYKGAELFVRRPSGYQPTVPSVTSSSTTPSSLAENSGAAPPVDISSPGEPRFLTFYHALETASIRNELVQTASPASLQRENLNSVTQDATSSTAQGTAGSGTIRSEQTTDTTTIPTNMFTTVSPTTTTSSSSSDSSTSPSSESSVTGTTVTTTTTTPTITSTSPPRTSTAIVFETTTTERPDARISMIGSVPETTVAAMTSPADATTVPATTGGVSENLNTISRMDTGNDISTTMQPSTSTGAASSSGAPSAMPTTMPGSPVSFQTPQVTTPYLGRFGGSRITPAPRFSPSSSTKAPLRDYVVYGIYPNKTIVRKRPEDNLIDARNVDSPYVIFGIFPDGRLVRKFPNGTIIPDPPRNPVEVVFSLSTTTTNRPPLRPYYYNQANQGTYNQYQAPAYYNNRRPIVDLMRNGQSPPLGAVDLGLTGNAIAGLNGGGPDFAGPLGTPGSIPTTTKMSDILLNTRMGTTPNTATAIAGMVRGPSGSQGGRIVQDRERDEATRTKEAGGQRSSVYIGQDKFVNYWNDGAVNVTPSVVSVQINSVASAVNDGPASSSTPVPSFDNLLNNQPNGQITAPPGFPWNDPLDQIFGITTNSPVITASVASNSLDDSRDSNQPSMARPVNPFAEVFAPVTNRMGAAQTAISPAASSSSTTTTTTTTTTSTTTIAPTTTTTPVTTTTTTASTMTSAATPSPTSSTSATGRTDNVGLTVPFGQTNNRPVNMQTQNAFGTTFNDLAFLNSLLQTPNTATSTTKTLSDVEELLANKILSLALGNPGAARGPKAILNENVSQNSILRDQTPQPSSGPLIIDFLPSSTNRPPTPATVTWKPSVTQFDQTSKPTRATVFNVPSTTAAIPTSTLVPSSAVTINTYSVPPNTNKPLVISTVKPITTPRPPRITTTARPSFGASLWNALFSGNLFGPTTTAKPVRATVRQIQTTPKIIQLTQKPISVTQQPTSTTQSPIQTTSQAIAQASQSVPAVSTTLATPVTPRDISNVQVVTPKPSTTTHKPETTSQTPSTTLASLLNNPNPRLSNVVSSTYSPEDDAKFLAALLTAAQAAETQSGSSGSKNTVLPQDDEAFLRAILTGQLRLPSATTTSSPTLNNAALLAALLKAQGIEPSTPSSNLREQLQLASLEKTVPSAGATSTTARPTTTTKRVTTTPRKVTTATSRLQTTTWAPSSTYPPPLFSSFNFGNSANSGSGNGNQVVSAARSFSKFLGAAISGAAQQLQSIVRNGTRIFS